MVCTLMGKGAFPESHELFVGWPGMHGAKAANRAMHEADLLIAAGARFDDRVTGRLDSFAPSARVVHIDVDPAELGKIRAAEVGVNGLLGDVLPSVLDSGGRFAGAVERTREWRARIDIWRARFPLDYPPAAPGGPLKPQWVIGKLAELAAGCGEVVWTTGVGQHQMWAMQYLPCESSRSFITSGGHGTMGFGLPAAIGAKAARPDATVVCVDGDGSFRMTCHELATSVGAELPVIVVIVNNQRLGMVHQWQTLFHDKRLSEVDLSANMPDYAGLAESYGALGRTVHGPQELSAAWEEAVACRRTAVLDVRVDPAEICFPMIVPGGAAAEQVEWWEEAR